MGPVVEKGQKRQRYSIETAYIRNSCTLNESIRSLIIFFFWNFMQLNFRIIKYFFPRVQKNLLTTSTAKVAINQSSFFAINQEFEASALHQKKNHRF